MRVSLLGAPRPVPRQLAPALVGSAVILLALPVFLIAAWPLEGWALAAVLWGAAQALAAGVARLPLGVDSPATSGVAGFGRIVRPVAVLTLLLVVAAADPDIALAAALVYALAYTLELAASVVTYYAAPPVR